MGGLLLFAEIATQQFTEFTAIRYNRMVARVASGAPRCEHRGRRVVALKLTGATGNTALGDSCSDIL